MSNSSSEEPRRYAARQVFIDNGIGRAGHEICDTEALRNAAREGRLSCSQIAEIGDHITRQEALCQSLSKRLRFVRAVRGDLHTKAPYLPHFISAAL